MQNELTSIIKDTMVTAKMMGLVEHVDGKWRLYLEDLLSYFGRSSSLVLVTDANGNRQASCDLWGGRYSVKLLAMDKTLFEWDDDHGPSYLNIEVVRHQKHVSNVIYSKRIESEKYGVKYACEELDVDVDARQLAQLFAVLGDVADNYADWRPHEQSS
ncbi:hypothetical protein IIY67_01210 [Candidatus Saccharibacteria bacterium]|nr:hypothetical protein [Candidatus Saccharibacteria bacterium]